MVGKVETCHGKSHHAKAVALTVSLTEWKFVDTTLTGKSAKETRQRDLELFATVGTFVSSHDDIFVSIFFRPHDLESIKLPKTKIHRGQKKLIRRWDISKEENRVYNSDALALLSRSAAFISKARET